MDRWSPILVVTPETARFGDPMEWIHFALLKARRDKKKLVILYCPKLFWKFKIRMTNEELYNIESDYSYSPGDWAGWLIRWAWVITAGAARIFYIACYRRSLRLIKALWSGFPVPPVSGWLTTPQIGRSMLYKPSWVTQFSWDEVPLERWAKEFIDPVVVRLNQQKHGEGERLRLELGIPLSDWFVCLHVRESTTYGDGDCRMTVWRNARIEDYYEAVKLITKSGGWVVRIGNPNLTWMPKMEKVIDLAHHPLNNDILNLYFMSQCRFFLGSCSGPISPPIFGKPAILTNYPGWVAFFPEAAQKVPLENGKRLVVRNDNLRIFKHLYSKSRRRFLSLQERMWEPYTSHSGDGIELGEDYVLYDNTPEEIRDVVQEFLDNTAQIEVAPLRSHLQNLFEKEVRDSLRRWTDQGMQDNLIGLPHESSILEAKYRLAAMRASAVTIGKKFVENNWFEDALNHAPAASDQVYIK